MCLQPFTVSLILVRVAVEESRCHKACLFSNQLMLPLNNKKLAWDSDKRDTLLLAYIHSKRLYRCRSYSVETLSSSVSACGRRGYSGIIGYVSFSLAFLNRLLAAEETHALSRFLSLRGR